MFCSAIFGLFCLTAPMGHTTADIENIGVGGSVSLTADGWTALLSLGTDAFVPLNPTKLAQICDHGVCVHYWRHCMPIAKGGIDCEFAIDEGYTSLSARITADSKDDLDRALSDIGYRPDYAKTDGAIVFSQFAVESPVADVPECSYGPDTSPDKGCPKQQPSPAN